MVRKCQACGKCDDSSPDVSFHRFPLNEEKRKIWVSLIGWQEDNRSTKFLYLCSNHFNPKDIITDRRGVKYLKTDTNPIPCHSAFQFTSDSSDSSVQNSPWRTSMGLPELSIVEEVEYPELPSIHSSSSSTATASEGKEEMLKLIKEKSPTHSDIKMKKRKRCYVGDMSSSDFSTPEKRRKNLVSIKKTVFKQRKQIHKLQTTVRRLKLRIKSLSSLFAYMREKCLISESSEPTISASTSGIAGSFFRRFLKGPSKQKYDTCLRSFALTLAFYSPKAYDFVSRTFNRSLPHLGTICKWYRSVDGSPGFTKEALNALCLKQKNSSTPILCNLVMDEMSIRRQVEWTGSKFTGYVDIGTNLDHDLLIQK